MPDLIAQGPLPEQRWRRKLSEGETLEVGRTTGRLAVKWDDRISRRHARLRLDDQQLYVERIDEARNPVFFRGAEADRCQLICGEHFVIGSTTFTLVNDHVGLSINGPQPVAEETISYELLQQLRFRDADCRIDALSQLPETLAAATTEQEQIELLMTALLAGISTAVLVAWVEAVDAHGAIHVRHWDRRDLGLDAVAPSARLIHQAWRSQASVIHTWRAADDDSEANFTQYEAADWAFCLPIADEPQPVAIYVAGRVRRGSPRQTPDMLQDDVKFVDLASRTLQHLRHMRRLERQRVSLEQFMSPVVIERLAQEDPEVVLAPRETNVSVLFCDLRGFSRKSEQAANDLFGLLQRVSGALGVMTHEILNQGGVVGDFHGDAAMGFWGWPLDQPDVALRACLAALRIRRECARVASDVHHPLSGFRMGIGIATGRAVAGKIGTVDQVKVTVFGPVVNLAARLEEMTKLIRAPILLDDATAQAARPLLNADTGRLRRVAPVRPRGLESPVVIHELLPPLAEYPEMPSEGIAAYERALDALLNRDWEEAFSLLHRVPAEDRVKDFLTVLIAQNNRTPPLNWDGVVPLEVRM